MANESTSSDAETATAHLSPEDAGARLLAIIEASPTAIVSLDPKGNVTGWNPAAEHIFGWTESEVLGKPSPTAPEDQREQSTALLKEVLGGKTVTGLRRSRLRKDGSTIELLMSTAPVSGADGRLLGTVILAEDLAVELRREEERSQLLASERAARAEAEQTAGRMARLQAVTAALSTAATQAEVAQTIVDHARAAFGADAGMVSVLDAEGKRLEVVYTSGFDADVVDAYRQIPLEVRTPATSAARTGEPVWIETATELAARYPDLASIHGELGHEALMALPVRTGDRILGAAGVTFAKARHFTADDRAFIQALAHQCGQALERARLYESTERARQEAESAQKRFEFLAEASKVLAQSLDYETTLQTVAALAVPRMADWCAIHVVSLEGQVRQVAVVHTDPAKVRLAHEFEQKFPYDPNAETGVPAVIRSGEPELTSEITDEMILAASPDEEIVRVLRGLGLKSSMTVPLIARSRTIGAITFVSESSDRRYGDGDVSLAMDLATRVALAVDNSLLYWDAQRSAAERAAVLGQITEGIMTADTAGRTTFINEAGKRLTGGASVTRNQVGGAPRNQFFTPEGEPLAADQLPLARAVREQAVTENREVLIRRTDGSEIIVQLSASPVRAVDGTLLGGVVTFRDVTAERTLERQKDDFLSAAAHDLKTPLTTIKGLAQILRRRAERAAAPEARAMAESLYRIDATTSRMTQLINELLDVSRLQTGRPLDLVRNDADLIDLLTRLVSEQQQTTDRHRIRMETDLTDLRSYWDEQRLERTFTNIVSNAVRYSPHGGEILIRVSRSDESEPEAVIAVRDEGMGIPEHDLALVFDRFHRGSNVSGRIPGTGIGLAGSLQIVQQHGGTISVDSKEGAGTTFVVRLPIVSSADEVNESRALEPGAPVGAPE